jgi:hypothetical protein
VAELRRDLDRGLAGGEEEAGGRGTVAGRALEPDPVDVPDLGQPGQQGGEAGRVVRQGRLGQDQADLVNQARRQGRLVGVDPRDSHRSLLPSPDTMGAGQAGKCALR